MVQIKKKVTLKAKTEQEPVVEPIQQSTKPTLRKKEPVKEPVLNLLQLQPQPQVVEMVKVVILKSMVA